MSRIVDRISIDDIREDFVPKESFISREFAELEKERMWPKVWQIACREEELPNPGNFITYEIAGEPIIVVRTKSKKLKAFYNVCQHRGRIMMEPQAGKTNFLFCRYHGWRWSLDGEIEKITDDHDWEGCPTFDKKDLDLKEVLVDTWGGFVFINMDPDAEPLRDYLHPIPAFLDCFEFEKWRYRWYKTVILPCNWKTALEGFNEAYHVAATHPQILEDQGDDFTVARTYGKHGMYAYPLDRRPPGAPAARTGRPIPHDLRPGIVRFFDQMDRTLNAMFTPRAVEASKRLMTEVQPGTEAGVILSELQRFHREAAEADGSGWPPVSIEQQIAAGTNWHMFPNHVFLQLIDGSIAYRARPNGDDPDSCIFDIWSLVRYPPGEEPPLVREFYPDWSVDTEKHFGLVLAQDFANFHLVQRGMHSRAFTGSRTNPVQEAEIPNMHRALYEYVFGKDKD